MLSNHIAKLRRACLATRLPSSMCTTICLGPMSFCQFINCRVGSVIIAHYIQSTILKETTPLDSTKNGFFSDYQNYHFLPPTKTKAVIPVFIMGCIVLTKWGDYNTFYIPTVAEYLLEKLRKFWMYCNHPIL